MQVFVVVPPSSMPPLSLLTRKNLSGSDTKPSSMKNVGSVAILFRRVRCPMLPKLPQEEAEKNIV